MNLDLGTRLKISRERKWLSQKEAADKQAISNTVLSNYERNKRDPDTEILRKMAKLYSVSVDYLLGLTNKTMPNATQNINRTMCCVCVALVKISNENGEFV